MRSPMVISPGNKIYLSMHFDTCRQLCNICEIWWWQDDDERNDFVPHVPRTSRWRIYLSPTILPKMAYFARKFATLGLFPMQIWQIWHFSHGNTAGKWAVFVHFNICNIYLSWTRVSGSWSLDLSCMILAKCLLTRERATQFPNQLITDKNWLITAVL